MLLLFQYFTKRDRLIFNRIVQNFVLFLFFKYRYRYRRSELEPEPPFFPATASAKIGQLRLDNITCCGVQHAAPRAPFRYVSNHSCDSCSDNNTCYCYLCSKFPAHQLGHLEPPVLGLNNVLYLHSLLAVGQGEQSE